MMREQIQLLVELIHYRANTVMGEQIAASRTVTGLIL